MEIRKLQQHGHSVAVNLPPKYLVNLHLNTQDYVLIELTPDKRIIISKYVPKQTEILT